MTDRTRRRLATIAAAPAAALTAWALVRLAGIDLVLSHSHGRPTVGPADVFFGALVGALAAWPVVRFIEHHSRRPRRVWAQVGSMALGLSIVGPSWLADGASAVALIGLHLVTAVVVIAGFSRSLQPGPDDCARYRCAPRWRRDVRA